MEMSVFSFCFFPPRQPTGPAKSKGDIVTRSQCLQCFKAAFVLWLRCRYLGELGEIRFLLGRTPAFRVI